MFYFLAEEDSEPEEEDKSRDSKHPRDSGCFESSENLASGREESNKEGEQGERVEERLQQEEEQHQQLAAVQEQLEEVKLDEGS